MKRLMSVVLILCMVLSLCSVSQAASPVMMHFYVNPATGSDSASGLTASTSFRTVERAMEAVRSYISNNNGTMTGDIIVNLGEGRYELEDYIQFTEADSAQNGYKIIYQGAGAKKTVISGGKEISGWKQQEDGLWVADAPQLEFARDLYINERPARRAASQKMIKGVANYLASDSYYGLSDGFYVNKSQMPKFNNPEDVVFHWTIAWKDYQIAVKDIIDDPQNSERLIVKLENPIWNSIFEIKDDPSTRVRLWPTFDKEFIAENALELLDEPGEFYFDKKIKKLYYYPRENEDMTSAQVIVPVLERIMRVDGRDYYHQASGLTFKNIGFAHATNPIAENSSYVNQQGEFPTCPQAAGNLTPGTVEVNYSNSIEFADCSIWGTELVTDLSKADFGNPVAVAVKNTATGGTEQWTLEIKNETVNSAQKLVPSVTSQNWFNLNPNSVMPVRAETMTVQPAYEPYIYKTVADSSVEWRVAIDNSDSSSEIDFIFGGKRKNIEPGVKEKGNSYYRLVLSKKKMILYNVQDGVQSTLPLGAKVNSGFVYGKANTVKAAMDGNNVKIYVNDNQIMSASLSGKRSFRGYCGIYNPTSTVKLISSAYQVKLTNAALNRPVFASWTADVNEPERMTDGRKDTAWVSNKFVASGKDVIDGSYLWALVDLGAEYSIDRIKIFTENNDVYASRDRQDYKAYEPSLQVL